MKLLARLAQVGFDGFSLSGCRRIIGLGSLPHIQRHYRRLGTSDSPAATENPASWPMLNCDGRSSDDPDAKTLAESQILDQPTGRHLRVSFGIAKPPASSYLYYQWAGNAPVEGVREHYKEVKVIAAHGDCLLLEARRITGFQQGLGYFVYRAGASESKAPSLSLLHDFRKPNKPILYSETNGILRRGDGDILVAQLILTCGRQGSANLRFLHLGRDEWDLKRAVPIFAVDEDGNDERFLQQPGCAWPSPYGHAAFPVGDRFLCWVDCRYGFYLCDLTEECHKLRYVDLPVRPGRHRNGNVHLPMHCCGLCGIGADNVSINTRCCCGSPGWGSCERSRHAFTVTAWNMCLTVNGPLTWQKETVLDCEEIWTHPAYEGLPRVFSELPVISLHNPDVVCLKVDDRGGYER